MAYRVKITDAALVEAQEYVEFIRDVKKEPAAAERWFRGLVKAVTSLEKSPGRRPLIPEGREFAAEIRHLLYHSHRIIFVIDEATTSVNVLRVYHGSRRVLRLGDLPQL